MHRLAVFELHHLGDAILALPFLRAAAGRYDTTVLCRPPVAGLLQETTRDLTIQELPDSWSARARVARSLALGPGDAAACVWADSRAHLLMSCSGTGTRAGFPMNSENYYAPNLPWRKRRLQVGKILSGFGSFFARQPLLNRPLQRRSLDQHHLESWKQLAEALDIPLRLEQPWISDSASTLPEGAQKFLNSQAGRPIVVLHPGGRLPTKRWPGFPSLLKNLASGPPVSVLVIQPPGEDAPDPCGQNQLLVPTQDWPELIAVLRAADLVLCNDSLASHLAAALGQPVLTIFGSGNPDWFAPYGAASYYVATDACRFRPCIDRCVMPSPICIESVSVNDVDNRLRRILSGIAKS